MNYIESISQFVKVAKAVLEKTLQLQIYQKKFYVKSCKITPKILEKKNILKEWHNINKRRNQ